ncbi:MAG: DciA family protein [Pseudomonadota bacterium]
MSQRKKPKGSKATHIGVLLPALLGPATQRFGFPVAALVADWRVIVGDQLAAKCLPRSLEKRQGGPRGRAGATLVVAVAQEDMIDIDYARDTLRLRVNDYLGRPFLAAVRVQPEPDLNLSPDMAGPATSPSPDPVADAQLAEQISTIDDQPLRDTLARLGRSVLQRKPG